jgi:hypothetical protein
MGGSTSKTKSDVFIESVNNAFVQSIQSCSMSSDVQQIISIKGDGNTLSNIEMNQVYTSLLTCIQDVNVVTKIQNDIVNAIKSASESQSVALLGVLGSSSSEVDTKLHESVRNAINVTTLTKLVNNIKAAQTVYVQGSGNTLLNINMKQVNSNIASSSQQVVANIDVLNSLKNTIDQSSKATQQDPIANFLNGLANLVSGPFKWIAIILVGGLIILVIFLNTGAGATVMGMAQDQMQDSQGYEQLPPEPLQQPPEPLQQLPPQQLPPQQLPPEPLQLPPQQLPPQQLPPQQPPEPLQQPPEPLQQLPEPLQQLPLQQQQPAQNLTELTAPLPPGLPKLEEGPSIPTQSNQPTPVNQSTPPINETINQSYVPPTFEEGSTQTRN